MMEEVRVEEAVGLEDYEGEAHLAGPVAALRAEAAEIAPRLRGRTVWMVNSTSQGGGVAEMLPKLVSLLNEAGVRCRWGVIGSDRPEFFPLTKRLHNMIHGQEQPPLDAAERALYEDVNRRNADVLRSWLAPGDLLVVHDPQPLALGALLRAERGIRAVFRSHIGIEDETPSSAAAWDFLRPYALAYDRAVFSLAEYAPRYLADRLTVIRPAIDPWSHKNRELSPHKLMGILCNAGLAPEVQPVITPPFEHRVMRLGSDGAFAPNDGATDIGLLFRPIVTQVSRWDRLKGFHPLLRGFVELKAKLARGEVRDGPRHTRRLELLRLVLAGPDPSSIQDDPEARDVLRSLVATYRELPPATQEDVAILSLPMQSRKENALVVNALQRCSTVIVQNSLREGFGLTATEALWKRVAVLGTRASGLRRQIRDGVDGLLTRDPEDAREIADHLDELLCDPHRREAMGSAGQRRVHAELLVFSQVRAWLGVLGGLAQGS